MIINVHRSGVGGRGLVNRSRDLDNDGNDAVENWSQEAIRTALERGSLPGWHRLVAAIGGTPWGPVARAVEEVLAHSRAHGDTEPMERVIARARDEARAAARRSVAAELSASVAASGLTKAQFASRLGTSASRLSTYLSGRVSPSADLFVRARRLSCAQPEPARASRARPPEGPVGDAVRSGRARLGSAGA
jgi:DNA-binding transcriptional regulator YiaG